MRDHRHAACAQALGHARAVQGNLVVYVDCAQAIRPAHHDPGASTQGLQFPLQRKALGAQLGKPAGKQHGRFESARSAFFQRGEDLVGGDRQYGAVGHHRQRSQRSESR